jgi:hypothetical protein
MKHLIPYTCKMTRKLLITCDKCAGPMASHVHAVAAMRSREHSLDSYVP